MKPKVKISVLAMLRKMEVAFYLRDFDLDSLGQWLGEGMGLVTTTHMCTVLFVCVVYGCVNVNANVYILILHTYKAMKKFLR